MSVVARAVAGVRRALGRGKGEPVGYSFGLRDRSYVIGLERVTTNGDAYLLPAFGMRRAARTIRDGAPHEPATHVLVHALLAEMPGDMVHAGTFFGPMIPSFARACRGTVYAFEPVLESYVLAKLTVQLNGIGNVLLFNAGLSETLALGHIETRLANGHHAAARAEIADTGQATTLIPIDTLRIERLALIQLDVEGHEIHALRGAAATIAAQRPVVMVEDNSRPTGDFLSAHGYALVGKLPGQRLWATAERLELARAALAQAEAAVPD